MGSAPNETDSEAPRSLPNVAPNMSGGSGQTRLIVEAVKEGLSDVKRDIKDIKDYRQSDFKYIIGMFAAGFVLLAGMIFTVYMKIDDKLTTIIQSTIKTETKLDDLIQRIPPAQTPPPRR